MTSVCRAWITFDGSRVSVLLTRIVPDAGARTITRLQGVRTSIPVFNGASARSIRSRFAFQSFSTDPEFP